MTVKNIEKNIPAAFRTECTRIMGEELTQMGIERIQGLGITPVQLSAWKKGRK